MMTNRGESVRVTSLVWIIFSVVLIGWCAEANATLPQQQFPLSETPDPYFTQDARSDSSAQRKSESGSPASTSNLWTPPKTEATGSLQPHVGQMVSWDSPVTDAALKSRLDKNDFEPRMGPTEFPSQMQNGSIIREKDEPRFPVGKRGRPLSSASKFSPRTPSTKPENTKRMDDSNLGTSFKNQTVSTPLIGASKSLSQSEREPIQSFEPGRVLALVGGKPIFVGDVLFEINQMIEKFMAGAPEEIKDRERQKMIPQILPKFVEAKILFLGSIESLPDGVDLEKVIEQAGKEFDDKALAKMMENSGIESTAEFDAHLRIQGSSLRQLRRSWSEEQLTKYFLGQQLNISSEVTHQEMLDKYRENYESYAQPARCRWEQVMIRFDRCESRTEAKSKIVNLGNEIVHGANFAAAARKNSHGYQASEGGRHDWTTKGALVSTVIEDAIFSLPIDKLSDIIESNDGYHIIRVLERTDATHTPFLEAQVDIKQKIVDEKRKQAFDKYVAELKRKIPVEYFLNDKVDGMTAARKDPTKIR